MMNELVLRLYVTGHTPRAQRAIQTAQALCARHHDGETRLEVIDILDHPQTAEQDHILATPTLVRESPLPRRRVVGDLSDVDQVLATLGLDDRQADAGRSGVTDLR